jgi:DUF1680 family protein
MTTRVTTLQTPTTPLTDLAAVAPAVPGAGAVRPLGLEHVTITGGFWGDRQRLNARSIIPHIAGWDERVGWIGNFDAAVDGTIAARRSGREFSDSEVYKLLEAMAWEIGRTGDDALERRFESIVERIGRAQEPDGYLNTRFGRPGQQPRYSDLEWGHELYCFGHLFQAAVARIRTGRHDRLVEIALEAADHVCATFGASGLLKVCGHPEVEVALVELYRATGERRYLDQAHLFLERRGRHTLHEIELGRAYFQDDVPIREATVLRGHAVRALYLTAGAIDDGVEHGDDELLEVLRRQYENTLHRRTYLTGGMGAHHQDEAFGEDFELPPDRAYCETCAGVASVMVAWRLLLATGDLAYADIIERTLYNVIAASPSETGDAFFYTNPLQQRAVTEEPALDRPSPRAEAQQRAPWFDVSCCPPNVSRTLAQLAAYVATTSDRGVQLLQYMPARIEVGTPAGGRVGLAVSTGYPFQGDVVIDVDEWPADAHELTLRIPAWARGATVAVDGRVIPAEAPSATLSGLRAGSRVTLRLPVEARWTEPDPRIDAVRGTVAVERGPLVMCLESVDLPTGMSVDRVRVDTSVQPVTTAEGATVSLRSLEFPGDGWPYLSGGDSAEGGSAGADSHEVALIPYHRWANRGPSTMRVWLPA